MDSQTKEPQPHHARMVCLDDLAELEPLHLPDRTGSQQARWRIPIYQRMYVWTEGQIRQLLHDIDVARRANKKRYYVGTLLAVEREAERQYQHVDMEIIDGQQRLTTLWLFCLLRMSSSDDRFEKIARLPGDERCDSPIPRLFYAIRDLINKWMKGALDAQLKADGESPESIDSGHDEETESEKESLLPLKRALGTIDNCLTEIKENNNQEGFIDFDSYLLNNVQFLLTRLPPSIDLNHLFEVVNDRSVQLEQHQIVKARLLSQLRSEDSDLSQKTVRILSKAWDACSDMNDYIESSLARVLSIAQKTVLYNASDPSLGGARLGSDVIRVSDFRHKIAGEDREGEDSQQKTLAELIEQPGPESNETEGNAVQEDTADEEQSERGVKSIVTFPMLLQHTLRLWLFYYSDHEDLQNIDDRELIARFDEYVLKGSGVAAMESGAERARTFVELLLQIRYLFDLHVIKWSEGVEEQRWIHSIRRLEVTETQDDESVTRAQEERSQDRALSMLQSMLYHTQNPRQHLWLTPFLGYLHARVYGRPDQARRAPNVANYAERKRQECGDRYRELEWIAERIDDGLNCSREEGSGTTLAERSRQLLEEPLKPINLINSDVLDRLYGEISQYWFYKADYVLWKEFFHQAEGQREVCEAWREYRMTSRSSVEHIYAQALREDSDDWDEASFHGFGNLALVSRERNSEFGDRSVKQKKAQFDERLKKGDLHSPKLAAVYRYGGRISCLHHEEKFEWTPSRAIEHGKWVKEIMCRYWSRYRSS